MVSLYIDSKSLALTALSKFSSNVVIENISKDEIKVWFDNGYRIAMPKAIKLNKTLDINETFVEAIGAYTGDGKLSKDYNHLEFTNRDTDLAKFVFDFFVKTFNLTINNFTLTIRYKNPSRDLKVKWSKVLGVPEEKFLLQKREKAKHDTISIQINSKVLRVIFEEIRNLILPSIKYDNNLRKAFLRGFFAADGKLGVEKDTNTYYISEMTFCYDALKERWLRDFIIECLRLEDVNKFFIEEKGNRGNIRITGWNNYMKFWSMRLLDRSERQKLKFSNVIKQAHIYLDIDKDVINILSRNIPQKDILNILDLHRTNMKRVKNNKQLLKIEQVDKLRSLNSKSWRFIIENTNFIRVGKLSYLDKNKEFIDFLLHEKGLKTQEMN